MKNIIRISIAATLLFGLIILLSGCASIIHGTRQEVTINSTPPEGDVVVKKEGGVEVFQGRTPATCTLERKYTYDVTINLAGYQEAKVHISKDMDPIYLGNVICGGIIGLVVDAVNGAMYKLVPEIIQVTLVEASINHGESEVYVVCRIVDDEGQLRTLVFPLIKA